MRPETIDADEESIDLLQIVFGGCHILCIRGIIETAGAVFEKTGEFV
jgi:hypothetical protein